MPASVEVALVSDTAAIVVASTVVDDARVVAESLAAPVVEATTDVTAADAATCFKLSVISIKHRDESEPMQQRRTVVEDRDTVASALVVEAETAVVCRVSAHTVGGDREARTDAEASVVEALDVTEAATVDAAAVVAAAAAVDAAVASETATAVTERDAASVTVTAAVVVALFVTLAVLVLAAFVEAAAAEVDRASAAVVVAALLAAAKKQSETRIR